MKHTTRNWLYGAALVAIAAATAIIAQEITGTPGSPNATTTIDGKQLPPPDPKFGGVIKDNALQSKAWWPPRVVPPKQAPNILLIMTDDVGFGAPSTFGGVIPTPALDRIANSGLRYTQFHSTALCSPTRAALITGRNHHSAGFGVVSEQSTGFPGYNSIIPKDKATIGRILKDNGFATSWFGKDHNTPTFSASQVGPFDQWPIGMGFDYFYGFVGGDTSQWEPNLFRNTTQIYPYVGKPGWNLTTAQADDAIDWLNRINQIDPSKPFFCYYVPGGTHAPHHATPEWIKKISDMHLFDDGWNKLRETIFANQKRLGVIPQDAKMTPWPDKLLKNWDQCTADEKKLFIRQVDVYAAYLAYTDHEIGRVIQAVEDMGKLDNTLMIYISGDNGSVRRGHPDRHAERGRACSTASTCPVEAQLKYFYDAWGSDRTYNHMAVPWTWAFDTPFSWTKQIASHFGGTRQGMCVSWPGHIKDTGGIRNQFHHMIDVVPTLLEVCGIPAPESVDGIKQAPIEGVSFAYTFDQANANAALPPQDAVFRDDGRPRHLSRGLDRQHESHPPALGRFRRRQPRPAKQLHLGTLRPEQGLDAGQRRRGPVSRQAEGNEGTVPPGSEEIRSAAVGRFGGDAARSAAAQPHRRPQRVCVYQADGGASARRLAVAAELLLYDHRRHRGAGRRRRGDDPHFRRALRRLRLLSAQGQAGVSLEPGGREARALGRLRTRSRRASTPSSSISSTTDSAQARWPSTT